MEPNVALHSRDEIWRLQTDMKAVLTTQIDHSDRLLRLERRYDEDFRMKSVWGSSSPFPGILSSTPQQDPNFNPAAEAFRSFDQDQGTSAVGSIHLDTDEEPRRGASRANSVRFDESALHGHFAQGSRSSSDFFPTRTGSGMGSHPMTERSSSHKSEGRQSSNGPSTRLNSLHLDTRPSSILNGNPLGPPPGLLLLGPVPSIIRCWLDTNFSNESLVYAAVCTGSCHSFIQGTLAQTLKQNFHSEIPNSGSKVRLDVFLPEAVFQQSSSRPSSPAPQLPTITIDFIIREYSCHSDSIQVVIGSDVLRLRNADILLSQDRITLFDDRHNKITVPLVRPENSNAYRNLVTFSSAQSKGLSAEANIEFSKALTNQGVDDTKKTSSVHHDESLVAKDGRVSRDMDLSLKRLTPFSEFEDVAISEGRRTERAASTIGQILPTIESGEVMQEPVLPMNGLGSDSQATLEDSGRLWGSWRRDPASFSRSDLSYSDAVLPSAYQKPGRGRGMKVLKPLKSSQLNHPSQIYHGSSSDQQEIPNDRAIQAQLIDNGAASISRKSFSSTSKSAIQGMSNQSRPMNPVGGASAFGWLTSDQRSERKMSTET